MWLNDETKLKEILNRLVNVPSVSGTTKERGMAEEVYNIMSEIPYFQENQELLNLKKLPYDDLDRYYVTALLKGKGSKTVILLHHHDVVDIEDFGSLREYAFNPEKITEKMADFDLPEEARKDLETGEWLFGRGVMDMKSGAALQIALMHDYSHKINEFDGNIVLVSVPDEENNSEGILSAVPHLVELRDKHDLEYISVIKSESHQPDSEGKNDIAIGSIGKILPLFYCFGKETHAGNPFGGLNSSLIFSQVEALMEKSPEFCDEFKGELTPPPVNLKLNDLRGVYNVTTPQVTIGYYNVMTINSSPYDVLEKMKSIAKQALDNSIEIYNQRYDGFQNLAPDGVENSWGVSEKASLNWEPKVYTFEELYNSAYKAWGDDFLNDYNETAEQLKESVKDEREYSIHLVNKAHDYCPDRNPKIVLAFLPPFYPHVKNNRETEKEQFILDVVENIKKETREKFGLEYKVTEFFKGISDLSFFYVPESEDIANYMNPNMPALNRVYRLPIEDISKLDVSVVNVGPVGKDAHQYTERLYLPFFTQKAPQILEIAVNEVLNYNTKQ
ncbi:M20/M25/M40 family metallo-hydrolase [Natranaerobius thermophilus]|uniref:Peptidase M20 n=1 Tax=Natranaerobius thermophilus (strain ATCC BAA-1301 / DSM 18059 / JW/NM-WN-LF) TaxID=457570 RepID=B2A2X2_NATTJ|nr:M20/M25/M40 family metallo-hydrolase [Natranaerobius thermophilus]ACB86340.1 peptidase M20 [Natranaerobius thermophilus JW/NM-WN-LF]